MVVASYLTRIWVWYTCVVDMARRPAAAHGQDTVGVGFELIGGRGRGRAGGGRGGPLVAVDGPFSVEVLM